MNSTALGQGAYTTASNQVVLGNSSITETVLRGRMLNGALPMEMLPIPNLRRWPSKSLLPGENCGTFTSHWKRTAPPTPQPGAPTDTPTPGQPEGAPEAGPANGAGAQAAGGETPEVQQARQRVNAARKKGNNGE